MKFLFSYLFIYSFILQRLVWYSSDDDIRMCKYKGKSEEACQNYIRVLAKKAENKVFICGTNAYKPKCREYLENVSERKKIR